MGAYASGLDRHSYKVKAGGSNPPVPTDLPINQDVERGKGIVERRFWQQIE